MTEIIDTFISDLPGRLDSLKTAAKKKAPAKIKAAAHALKGGSRSVGAMALGDLCQSLEDACSKDPGAVHGLIKDLLAAAAAAKKSLESRRKTS